ncbi:MAG: acetate--CoA ligase [Patescibacteria group bacterium]
MSSRRKESSGKREKLVKKDSLYYPTSLFKNNAWVGDKSIYQQALSNPIKFWQKAAREILWIKKWKKPFSHRPPYFKWFLGGKINITQNALDRNLETRKNKVALIWEPEPREEKERVITYYQLYREVNKLANALRKLGVKKGDRVGIYLPMIPEIIISMLACSRIGAIHAVVFSAFSPQALRVRLQDTEAKILITADGYFRRGKAIDLKQNADDGVKETKVEKVIVVKRLGKEIVLRKGRDYWLHDLVEEEQDWCESVPMDSEDIQFILYTSGSTGKPKGIVHTCGGYTVQAYLTSKFIFDLKEGDIFWSTADIGWITGHTYSCYGPLINGSTFLIFEGSPDWPNPDRWCEIIEKYGVTIFYTAPTAIRMFAKQLGKIGEKFQFKTLRLIASVGEPINETAWQWYFNEVGKGRCPLLDTWWQTETGGILISSLPGIGPFKPVFTGAPFPGVKLDIFDDKGKSLPAGKEGNLVILPPFTPGMLRGIYKNHEKYVDTYWSQYSKKTYFTSDGAFRDKEGLIRIIGRVDDVIKVAGHRIATGELENAIAQDKRISECAVVGIPDEIKGEVPLVFAVLEGSVSPEEMKQQIILGIRKEIGPIAMPKDIYFTRDLPKTRSGKIMRRILKKLWTKEELGDLSTLANPESVGEIRNIINF